MTGDNSSSISRKVKEWIKAFELEFSVSKDDILQAYLNIIYVGPNVYGVQMGSEYYFSKNASELSLAECAFLAGINDMPNSYNPFGDSDNTEKICKRTNTVLSSMLDNKYISIDEYNTAKAEVDNGLSFKKGNVTSESDGVYSYHTDALVSEVLTDIQNKKHIDNTFATNYLYMAGLNIYSTQDSNIQSTMEKEYAKSKYLIKSDNGNVSQSSMNIMDQSTGYVVGCVGGLGSKDTARGFNRATQALRQNGSSGKPLSVLAPALNTKLITAADMFDDSKTEFTNINGDLYTPRDNDDIYLGNITLRRALESSQNIPFVRIINQLTPKTSIKYLKKMGISTLTDKDNNLSLALGGLDKGVSNLEMTAAYAMIANDGVYISPTFYKKVDFANGKTFIKSKQRKRRVLSKSTACVLKQLLKQPVVGSHGTASNCAISNMDVAAKTGTTDNNCDKWLCGFTNYYTAVTWFGYDNNDTIHISGHSPASSIWSSVMNSIHSDLPASKFEIIKDVESSAICPDTGLLANSGCPNAYTEYFIKGTVPDIFCNVHTSSSQNNTTTKSTKTEVKSSPVENITNENNSKENVTTTQPANTSNNTNNTSENKTSSENKSSTKNETHTNSSTNKNTTTSEKTNSSVNKNTQSPTTNSTSTSQSSEKTKENVNQ